MPLELDLNAPASIQAALADLVKQGRTIDFLLLNAGLVPTEKRVITEAGVEASRAPLIGHHQLTVGLLRADLLSPGALIVIAGAEPARGGVPMFKHTDLPAFAAKNFQSRFALWRSACQVIPHAALTSQPSVLVCWSPG